MLQVIRKQDFEKEIAVSRAKFINPLNKGHLGDLELFMYMNLEQYYPVDDEDSFNE